MRLFLLNIILFSFTTFILYGQPCGQEYSTGFYHNHFIVTLNGDTINKLDSSGFYEGIHVYTDNENNLYNKKTGYTIGHFNHGQPIGDWTEHCSDGSFSIGQYESGEESTQDANGNWIEKKQGIYAKIGVWKYFDKDSNLIKTMRYERFVDKKGWTNNTYLLDESGNFILLKSDFISRCKNLDLSPSIKDDIIVLPGTGIIYNKNKFLLDRSFTRDILDNIDTVANEIEISYSQNIFSDICVRVQHIKSTDLKKRKYKKRGSYNCDIFFNNFINLSFVGHYLDSLVLNKVIIQYPIIAKTNDDLEIGIDFEKIFEKYSKIEGSYNSCSMAYCYNYPDKGISFYVSKDKDCELFHKISGIEIFKSSIDK